MKSRCFCRLLIVLTILVLRLTSIKCTQKKVVLLVLLGETEM